MVTLCSEYIFYMIYFIYLIIRGFHPPLMQKSKKKNDFLYGRYYKYRLTYAKKKKIHVYICSQEKNNFYFVHYLLVGIY